MPTNSTENIYSTEFENDPNPIPSTRIGYDNTESGLTATTVQGAIDELDSKIEASDEASEITYDNTESGLAAENVQAAIDELADEKQDKSYDNTTSGLTATTIVGAIDELADELNDNYIMNGNKVVSTDLTDKTFNDLINNNELYSLMNNALNTLADDEICEILSVYTSPTYSEGLLEPTLKNLYTKQGVNGALNFSGVFHDSTNARIILAYARIASSDSVLGRTLISDNDGTVSNESFSTSSTSVTKVSFKLRVYKKL